MKSKDYDPMDRWLDELDVLGGHAPVAELQAHLERAPDPEHPDVAFLAGYLSGQLAPRL